MRGIFTLGIVLGLAAGLWAVAIAVEFLCDLIAVTWRYAVARQRVGRE